MNRRGPSLLDFGWLNSRNFSRCRGKNRIAFGLIIHYIQTTCTMVAHLQHWALANAVHTADFRFAPLGVALVMLAATSAPAELEASAEFHKSVQPILTEYCYDCHGDGAKKGNVAFDELNSDEALLNHDLWFKVLKNVRAGLMPPQKKARPSHEEEQELERWIKYSAFGLDPNNPDPGRVTVRRLNRVEYRNTIHDLMGIDFNASTEFPPDDTGYGFDDIGDVLTVSPMLLEKYVAAANDIVAEAVPTVSRVITERTLPGKQFSRSQAMSYYERAAVSNSVTVDTAGSYSVTLGLGVKGGFDFDPGRCRVVFKINDQELLTKEFGWYDNKTFHFEARPKMESRPSAYDFGVGAADAQGPKAQRSQFAHRRCRVARAAGKGALDASKELRPLFPARPS